MFNDFLKESWDVLIIIGRNIEFTLGIGLYWLYPLITVYIVYIRYYI
jgi:hypothetical protein